MPPAAKRSRGGGGWTVTVATATDRDQLKRCFLWELAQALKAHYLTDSYNLRQKVTFTRNYSEHIPLKELRDAAWAHFAPVPQRLCALLA